MTDVQVVIPWRDTGEPHRRAHFQHLRWWYGLAFDVVIGDRPGEFNRSAARNAGVAAASADVVAVVDADNLIAHQSIEKAARVARDHGGLVKPFRTFGYLSQESTDAYYAAGDLPPDLTWEGDGPAQYFTGGAYVMRRVEWPGMDEGFVGWGGEDDAFTITCQRRYGKPRTVPGGDLHLWHPSPGRWASAENYARLMEVYVHGHQPS